MLLRKSLGNVPGGGISAFFFSSTLPRRAHQKVMSQLNFLLKRREPKTLSLDHRIWTTIKLPIL